MSRRKMPAIPDELLDQLLAGSDHRTALTARNLLDGLKKALAERVLNAEMDHHLEAGEPDGRPNGRSQTAKAAQRGFSRLGPSGCDAGKKVVGRKRNLRIATIGMVVAEARRADQRAFRIS